MDQSLPSLQPAEGLDSQRLTIGPTKGTDMTIHAKFIGPKTSLGYVPGEVYRLIIDPNSPNTITNVTGKGKCVYGSVHAFLSNWSIVAQNL
jgi:hypothetical protein